MKPSTLLSTALLFATAVLGVPTRTRRRSTRNQAAVKRAPGPGFVYPEDGKFKVDGQDFYFVGTTAYWLTQLNSENDIAKVLASIASKGIKVVRTWGFREVEGTAPPDPTKYTTLWQDGTQFFSQPGANRIKFILDTAQQLGLKVQIALTNNWDPVFPENFSRPPGFLSNQYGGMDTYVRQLSPGGFHDGFYSETKVKKAFKRWIDFIVPQISNHTALFGWELANDPRCRGGNKDIECSKGCKATTITKWTNEISAYVKEKDPNHMVASGDGGFYCVDCPKLNPTIPPPGPSPVPGKRHVQRRGFLTKGDVLKKRKETAKHLARVARTARTSTGPRIRGLWFAPKISDKIWSRQDTEAGPGYDGSYGVDTEDIANSPSVDYSSFQFFPDQNTYSSNQGGGSSFQDNLQGGIDWIQHHADSAQTFGKPTTLNGFGLVTDSNRDSFVPVDSTQVGADTSQQTSTDEQQSQAYSSWTDQAIQSGVNGVTHYQWGETGLQSQDGSVVDNSQSFSNTGDTTQGSSPNDGYSTTSPAIQGVLQNAAAVMNAKSGDTSA